MYLAAYAQRLGATGLTFFDDEVTDFFSPHAANKSAIFLVAIRGSRAVCPDIFQNRPLLYGGQRATYCFFAALDGAQRRLVASMIAFRPPRPDCSITYPSSLSHR